MAEARATHMPDRVHVRAIVVAALAVAAAVTTSLVTAYLLRGSRANVATGPPAIAGGVTLQPAPARDIAAYRAEKRRLISGYAWVDRERGIVRIPIERAMELRVQQARASP
jgi:hypothetical protein